MCGEVCVYSRKEASSLLGGALATLLGGGLLGGDLLGGLLGDLLRGLLHGLLGDLLGGSGLLGSSASTG